MQFVLPTVPFKDYIIMKKEKILLTIIIACYFTAGMIALNDHSVLSRIERDGTEFLFDAKRILEGQSYDSDFWPFGYMVAIAGVNLLTSLNMFVVGKLITLLSGTAVCILTYLIAEKVFSEKVGLLAVIILATNHLFFLHSFLVETDMLFVAFFMLAIYFLVSGDRGRDFILAGSASGIAYMVKYGVYAFFPVVFLLVLISFKEKGWVDSVKKMTLFIVSFLVLSSPWLYHNKVTNGSAMYSKHHVNIAWGMNRPRPLTHDYWRQYFVIDEQYKSMADVVSETRKFIGNWVYNIKGLPGNMHRSLYLMSFFVLPGFLMAFKDFDRKRLILVLITMSLLGLVTIAYTWDRYLLPLIPLFSIFIAYVMYNVLPETFNLERLVRGISYRVPFRVLVITMVVLLSGYESYGVVGGFMQHQQTVEYETAGEWLKENIQKDDWLMVSEPHIAWYAGTDRFVKYETDKSVSLQEAVGMRSQNTFFFIQEGLSADIVTDIDYFIYDKNRWRGLFLEDAPVIPANFTMEYSIKGSYTEIVIYKVNHE